MAHFWKIAFTIAVTLGSWHAFRRYGDHEFDRGYRLGQDQTLTWAANTCEQLRLVVPKFPRPDVPQEGK